MYRHRSELSSELSSEPDRSRIGPAFLRGPNIRRVQSRSNQRRLSNQLGKLALAATALVVSACVGASSYDAQKKDVDRRLRSNEQPSRQLDAAPHTGAGSANRRVDTPEAVPPSATSVKAQAANFLRAGDWKRADELLATLSVDDAEAALARSWALTKLEQPDAALEHLDRALGKLPGLETLLEDHRQQLQLASARYLEALPEMKKSRSASRMLQLGERLLADGHTDDAALIITRAAKFVRNRDQQAELRFVRAKLSMKQGRTYSAKYDWRWLALQAPLHERARDIDTLISEHFPREPLKPQERMRRAQEFADAGRITELEHELKFIESARYYRASASLLAHLRAWAQYRARRFPEAARLLQEAADMGGAHAGQDRYYAARALSRMGQPLEAIRVFEVMERARPKTKLNQTAAFRIAREWALLGSWSQAFDSYQDFLSRYPNNEYVEPARREMAIAAFAKGDYSKSTFWFKRLRYLKPRAELAGHYHLMEALSTWREGKLDEAKQAYQTIARTSPISFEGWIARARLRQMGETPESPIPPKDVEAATPAPAIPLPGSVQQLLALGLDELAEEELERHESEYRALGKDKWQALCSAYDQLDVAQRHFRVAYSAAKTNNFYSDPPQAPRWLWECLHPEPHVQMVQAANKEWQVPAALIYAVMRQESAFRHHAYSSADARGLMQVIPPTGRAIAKELGLEYSHELLFQPRHAIRFGAFYLNKMLGYFNAHPALAASAYNAGPEATSHWEYAGQHLPLELFVARIPYDQTRTYVRKVISNLFVYQALYPELGDAVVPLDLSLESAPVVMPLASPAIPLKHE